MNEGFLKDTKKISYSSLSEGGRDRKIYRAVN